MPTLENPNIAEATSGAKQGVESLMKKIRRIEQSMENEVQSFQTQYEDLSNYIKPRRGRFSTTDTNKGSRKDTYIIDNTATLAANTLSSGIMGGVTNPARPWFKLTTSDPDLNENKGVMKWNEDVSDRMSFVLSRSNLYNVLPDLYGDSAVFGTGAMLIEEDFENVLRCYSFPVGEYQIGTSDKGLVNKFHRKFMMTVYQIVERFGRLPNGNVDWTKISTHVKNLYETNATEEWIEVQHIIMPNEKWDERRPESRFKRYISVYHESSCSDTTEMDRVLSEKGYDYFPVIAPRWRRAGTDIYGTDCPGMIALGDVKQLQKVQSRILLATEKSVNPSLLAPAALKGKKITQLPGDVTFIDETTDQKVRSVHDPTLRLNEAQLIQQETRDRINEAFFVPLFLMLSMSDRRQVTAREVEEKHEEKLLMLGPVLFTIEEEILNPIIDIAFTLMLRQGLIPEPPEEVQGQKLTAEYISVLFQAQKMTALAQHERFQMFALQWAGADPTVLDTVNRDAIIRAYADAVGVPSDATLEQGQVDAVRADRAAQAQAAQEAQNAAMQAKAAKDLGTTPMDQNSALDGLLDQAGAGDLTGMVE